MSTGLPLFDSVWLRKADPPRYRAGQTTSKLAADELIASGKMREQQAWVLGVVRSHPNHSALELDRLAGTDRVFGRRLSELRRRGMVRNGDVKVCAVTKRKALTWLAAEHP